MNWKPFAGLLLLAAVAGAVYFFQGTEQGSAGPKGADGKVEASERIEVPCYVGGEKSRYLKNPRVQEILAEKYGLVLKATKAGSIEMVTTLPVEQMSCLWPSNQVAVELYRGRSGVPPALAQETIFNSPIVLYTWDVVAEALAQEGLVESRDGVQFLTGFDVLVGHLESGTSWQEIGLPQLFGKIKIFSTDPRKSNSGNMFSGLMANMLNGGDVVGPEALETVLPKLKSYFERMGYMESSSGDIFENFLKTGVGAKPIVVGYENQLIEFAIENQRHLEMLRQRIRTLYPVPTVWSSHPLMALDSKGKRLIEAFEDPELQQLAWTQHGFRSGLMGAQNDPADLPVTGLPASIEAVVPMPTAEAMGRIIDGL